MAATQTADNRIKQPAAAKRQGRKKFGIKIDWMLLLATAVLLVFGLLMVYSASSYNAQIKFGDSGWYLKKQLTAAAIGAVGLIAATLIPYDFWKRKVTAFLFWISIVLLMLVLSPIGIESYGAKRWIDIKVFTLQPSEVVKVGLILLMASILYKYEKYLQNMLSFLLLSVPTLIAAGLCAIVTDDLGTAMVMFVMGIVMMFVTCPKKKYVVLLVAIIALLAVIMILSKSYRRLRIKAWLNVEAYADDEGYQIMQGLYAIGSGGLFGKGIGKSTQKMSFVPECENDMIFSIICEELGIFGAVILIAMIAILVWRLWVIYKQTEDKFGKLIIAGIMAHIAFQSFLNMGVVTSLLPNTGVPLPFISYGGSSIIMLMIEIGLALSVSSGRTSQAGQQVMPVIEFTRKTTMFGMLLEIAANIPSLIRTKPAKPQKKKRPASSQPKNRSGNKRPVVREDKSRGVIYYK